MKKQLKYFSILGVALLVSFASCTNDIPDADGSSDGKVSQVKSITYKDQDWEETHTFIYREDGRVTKIVNSYGNTSIDWLFDWSVPGKLTIAKPGDVKTYEVNADGFVTKDPDDGGYYNTYVYDENGFLIKITENWDGGSEDKFSIETKANNVLKHKRVRSGRNYEKTFEYTTGLNTCNIQQTNPVDSYWKTQCGIYGKASNRLVRSLWYGYIGESGTSTKLNYVFDENRRPAEIVRQGDGWKESVLYTYYE